MRSLTEASYVDPVRAKLKTLTLARSDGKATRDSLSCPRVVAVCIGSN